MTVSARPSFIDTKPQSDDDVTPTQLSRHLSEATIEHVNYTRQLDTEITAEQCHTLLQSLFHNNPLFARLTVSDTELLSQVLTVLHFTHNDKVLHVGEKATFCALILSGNWYAQDRDRQNVLAPGSFIGEFGYFEGGLRSADIHCTADANTPAVLGVLTYEDIDRLRYMGKEGASLHTHWLYILANSSISRLRQFTNTPQYTIAADQPAHTAKESLFLSKGTGLVSKQETLIIQKYKQQADDSLHIEIQKLKKKLAVADKNARDNVYTMENLQRKYAAIQDECASQLSELSSTRAQLEHATTVSTGQATLIENWRAHKQQSDAQYQRQVDEYKALSEQLQAKYILAQQQLDLLSQNTLDNTAELKKQCTALTEQNAQLQQQLTKMTQQCNDITQLHTALKAQHKQLQHDIISIRSDNDYVKFRYTELTSKYSDALHQISALEYKSRLLEIEANEDVAPVTLSDVVQAISNTPKSTERTVASAERRTAKQQKQHMASMREQLKYKKLKWLIKFFFVRHYVSCAQYRHRIRDIYTYVCTLSKQLHKQLQLPEPELEQPAECNHWSLSQYIQQLEHVLYSMEQPLADTHTYCTELTTTMNNFFAQNMTLKDQNHALNDKLQLLQGTNQQTTAQLQQLQQQQATKRLHMRRNSNVSLRPASSRASQRDTVPEKPIQPNTVHRSKTATVNKTVTQHDINTLIVTLDRTLRAQTATPVAPLHDVTQLCNMNITDKLQYIRQLQQRADDGYSDISPYNRIRPNSRTGIRLQHAAALYGKTLHDSKSSTANV